MCEVTTRLGPLRLTWEIDYTSDSREVLEVFATLKAIGWDGSDTVLTLWRCKSTPDSFCRQATDELQLFADLEERFGHAVAASDAAREAIEAERLDLQREDAERYSEGGR